MDVLRPNLLWIGGRCYRQNIDTNREATSTCFDFGETEKKSENVTSACFDVDETCEDDCDVFQQNGGPFVCEIAVPAALMGNVVGQKGITKRRIETDTNVIIAVPKQGVEGKPIVIKGKTRQSVLKARCRVVELVKSARQRHHPTHFLSIPLTGPPLTESFARFQKEVLERCKGDRGINASLFQNPKKLHLTIGVLVLLDKRERQKANEVLEDCMDKIIRPILGDSPLVVDVKGISYMNDDPGEVDVLYANVLMKENSERLQILADRLVQHFMDAGLMSPNRQLSNNVKIHATVMNSQFLKSAEEVDQSGTATKGRQTFDGRELLQVFKDFHFGTYTITTIHLSQRFMIGDDGYYLASKKLML